MAANNNPEQHAPGGTVNNTTFLSRSQIPWTIYISLFVHYYPNNVHVYKSDANMCSSHGKKPANHNIITVLQEKSDIDQNKFLQIDDHTSNKNVLLSYHITSTEACKMHSQT